MDVRRSNTRCKKVIALLLVFVLMFGSSLSVLGYENTKMYYEDIASETEESTSGPAMEVIPITPVVPIISPGEEEVFPEDEGEETPEIGGGGHG